VALDVFAVVLTWQVQTVHTVLNSVHAALHAHYSADSTVLQGSYVEVRSIFRYGSEVPS
jgi:hypothetical protein